MNKNYHQTLGRTRINGRRVYYRQIPSGWTLYYRISRNKNYVFYRMVNNRLKRLFYLSERAIIAYRNDCHSGSGDKTIEALLKMTPKERTLIKLMYTL